MQHIGHSGGLATPFNMPPAIDDDYDHPLPVGTLLHKGFYDLLAMITRARRSHPSIPDPPLKKDRRVTKDMVSRPTGFV